jgi:alpha-maltose-1-phosphate synthase
MGAASAKPYKYTHWPNSLVDIYKALDHPPVMRVIQTAFGVFHHFELARELERRGHLKTIYSTYPWMRLKREGIDHSKVETFPWFHTAEMLALRVGLNRPWVRDPLGYTNALAFDEWTLRRLRRSPAPDALIALSGSSLKTGREVQARGGLLICDRGSSHARYQEQIVAEEYKRWKVDRPIADSRDIRREESIYEMADAITVPSTFAARSFIESGVAADKIHVIPYGVRLQIFKRTGKPLANRFEVLYAGSVSLRKGFPYLLQAFAKLRNSTKRLRVAGAIHPDMKTLLAQLPQNQVEFLGSVSQERVAELMSTSHLLVLPSIEEGLALVQGQALACGCPVLSSTNTGANDLFTNEIEGFIVPIRDVSALVDRMQCLSNDPALQASMSQAALRRVSTLGGWKDYGDRWESLLESLIATRSSASQPPPTK